MFGRRATAGAVSNQPPIQVHSESEVRTAGTPRSAAPAPVPPPNEPRRSDDYYVTKSTIFSALIEAIDLSQLSKLDAETAREEIRDIVNEIISLRNVVMSIAEQEDLLDDICNDVLGYGPLEPLLARDDIADIMVNGATKTYIEVGGKIQLTNVRFRDNAQLMNICQRIVSQIGRRVDEASPICDARLMDGSRVNVIAPPLALDGPALTIRKFQKGQVDPRSTGALRLDLARWCRSPEDRRQSALQRPDFGRHRFGQDHAAELSHQLHRKRRAGHHLRGRGGTATPAAPYGAARDTAAQSRRYGAPSRCATSFATAFVCGRSGSSWARCAARKLSTCFKP